MRNAIAEGVELLQLIPQRPPVVMIDKLLEASERRAVSSFTVDEECIFSDADGLNESGLVENIAQTAAAMSGYDALKKNETVRIGFIGAVKNLVIHSIPPLGSEIKTTVKIEAYVLNVTIIKGEIRKGDELLAECEMKIFLEEK